MIVKILRILLFTIGISHSCFVPRDLEEWAMLWIRVFRDHLHTLPMFV